MSVWKWEAPGHSSHWPSSLFCRIEGPAGGWAYLVKDPWSWGKFRTVPGRYGCRWGIWVSRVDPGLKPQSLSGEVEPRNHRKTPPHLASARTFKVSSCGMKCLLLVPGLCKAPEGQLKRPGAGPNYDLCTYFSLDKTEYFFKKDFFTHQASPTNWYSDSQTGILRTHH